MSLMSPTRPNAKNLIGTDEGALDPRNPDNETPAETAYLRAQFAQHGGVVHPATGQFVTGQWKHKFPDQVKQELLTKMRNGQAGSGVQGATMGHSNEDWKKMFPNSKVGEAPAAAAAPVQALPAGVTPSAQVRHDATAPAASPANPTAVAAAPAPVTPSSSTSTEQVGKGKVTTYASNQGVDRVLASPFGTGFSHTPARPSSPTDPRALAGSAPAPAPAATAAVPPLPITAGVPAATPGLLGAGVGPTMKMADTRIPSPTPPNDPRALAGADGDGADKETAGDAKSEAPSVLDRAPAADDEEKRKNRDLIAQMRATYH